MNASTTDAHLDAPDGPGPWVARLAKGIAIGIGFILPGLSGGVLAVIFKLYAPLIGFLSRPQRRFGSNVRFFLPVGIGGAIGVLLFSILVVAAFGRYEAAFVSLFIGFVVGTFPSLWRQAGQQGRRPRDWVILTASAVAILALMIAGGGMALQVPTGPLTWLISGALIGLGVIVPGMSPSNFLIYLGLYDQMAAGIKALDLGVILPLAAGLIACVLLFAKAARWAFERHYSAMYHFILGMVIGSSIAIFPTIVFTSEALAESGLGLPLFLTACLGMLVLGTILSWLFSRVEDRYGDERAAIDGD